MTDFPESGAPSTRPGERALRGPRIEAHHLLFTGTGAEYFRVWIVNVLLGIATLGIYTPWARRRTARWFYGHTEVAGHPLEFTAGTRSMVVGFLMLAAIYIALRLASDTGQVAMTGVIVLGGAVLSPYLWGSAMRFRLANTRWRGLRLHFTAGWGDIYRASWPVFALAAVWFVIAMALPATMQPGKPPAGPGASASASSHTASPPAAAPDEDEEAELDADADDDAHEEAATPRPALPRPGALSFVLIGAGLLAGVLCMIGLNYNYQRLLVERTRLGGQAGRWKPAYRDFVRIWVGTVAVFLLTLVVVAAVAFGITQAFTLGMWMALIRKAGFLAFVLVLLGLVIVSMVLFLLSSPALAYREAKMFQLVWNNVGLGQMARFRSNLRPGAYIGLRLRNMALTLLTLGFYRPFARVAEYQMKLESVTLHVKGDVDALVGDLNRHHEGAFGDAVADAIGLDLVG